jgi:hypothetical protein
MLPQSRFSLCRARIRGALHNLGHGIGRNTIKRILLENGFDPAPFRRKETSWKTFLKSSWGAIAATDFFSVEVVAWRGLARALRDRSQDAQDRNCRHLPIT